MSDIESDLARAVAALVELVAEKQPATVTYDQVRAHPLYWEQVKHAIAADERADRQRAEIARLHAGRAARIGPITEEPTDLGAVIVATVDGAQRLLVRADNRDNYMPWRSPGGPWCEWSDLTTSRWATATERATGKVDPDQDEPCDLSSSPVVDSPDRLEWLKGGDTYAVAPLGTIASAGAIIETITKTPTGWIATNGERRPWPYLARTVTRWGYGPGWEPGTDVTDRLDQAPKGVILVDVEGDFWRRGNDDLWGEWLMDSGEWYCGAFEQIPSSYLPLTVATNEQMREAGILTGGEGE